jgi:hypothetical protein
MTFQLSLNFLRSSCGVYLVLTRNRGSKKTPRPVFEMKFPGFTGSNVSALARHLLEGFWTQHSTSFSCISWFVNSALFHDMQRCNVQRNPFSQASKASVNMQISSRLAMYALYNGEGTMERVLLYVSFMDIISASVNHRS